MPTFPDAKGPGLDLESDFFAQTSPLRPRQFDPVARMERLITGAMELREPAKPNPLDKNPFEEPAYTTTPPGGVRPRRGRGLIRVPAGERTLQRAEKLVARCMDESTGGIFGYVSRAGGAAESLRRLDAIQEQIRQRLEELERHKETIVNDENAWKRNQSMQAMLRSMQQGLDRMRPVFNARKRVAEMRIPEPGAIDFDSQNILAHRNPVSVSTDSSEYGQIPNEGVTQFSMPYYRGLADKMGIDDFDGSSDMQGANLRKKMEEFLAPFLTAVEAGDPEKGIQLIKWLQREMQGLENQMNAHREDRNPPIEFTRAVALRRAVQQHIKPMLKATLEDLTRKTIMTQVPARSVAAAQEAGEIKPTGPLNYFGEIVGEDGKLVKDDNAIRKAVSHLQATLDRFPEHGVQGAMLRKFFKTIGASDRPSKLEAVQPHEVSMLQAFIKETQAAILKVSQWSIRQPNSDLIRFIQYQLFDVNGELFDLLDELG